MRWPDGDPNSRARERAKVSLACAGMMEAERALLDARKHVQDEQEGRTYYQLALILEGVRQNAGDTAGLPEDSEFFQKRLRELFGL